MTHTHIPKKSARKPTADAFELHIQFAHISPPIWRLVLVHSAMTLEDLHGVIQEMFHWSDYHLYQFSHAGRKFTRPTPDFPGEDATHTTLANLSLKLGDTISYAYDFGDGWELQLRVDAVEPVERSVQYPQCLGGARAGPPEDSGGPPFYDEFHAILADTKHPEHAERLEWVGPHFDAAAIDLRMTNRMLGLLFAAVEKPAR